VFFEASGEEGLLVCMYYVYIVKSEKDKSRYTGITEDLKRRLAEHNNGSANINQLKVILFLFGIVRFLINKKLMILKNI